MSFAAIMGFRLFSHYVTQAYLRRKSIFSRKVYIKPKSHDREILAIRKIEMLKLVRPPYGLCDAGEYWAETMKTNLVDYLGKQKTWADSALVLKEWGEIIRRDLYVCGWPFECRRSNFLKTTRSLLWRCSNPNRGCNISSPVLEHRYRRYRRVRLWYRSGVIQRLWIQSTSTARSSHSCRTTLYSLGLKTRDPMFRVLRIRPTRWGRKLMEGVRLSSSIAVFGL